MKFSEASGLLANLNYQDYKLKDLIDIGKSVTNFKHTTLDKIELPKQYDSSPSLVQIKELKVDIRYQRKMRFKKLIDKLKSAGTFNKEAAGHIDVARRPNGDLYVWDGFRRAFMAGICELETIPASIYYHPANRTTKQCEEYEAQMFKMRNADTENMKQEEIFRAEIQYRQPESINFLDFLRDCNLDVEELNPGNKTLGGFVQLKDCWKNKKIQHHNIIDASRIIQNTWSNDPNVSGYLLCGLGKFLDINEEVDESISLEEIQELFHTYVNVNPPKKQDSLTNRRLNKKANESIAYCIAVYVMNLKNKQLKAYSSLLNLDDDDVELLEEN
jgi:hypothetical protein